jgi:hypothetical protein
MGDSVNCPDIYLQSTRAKITDEMLRRHENPMVSPRILLGLLLVFVGGTSWGANFAVCPTGATSASSCSTDPNPIGGSDFLVGSVSAAHIPVNPFLILLAIPDQGDGHSLSFTVPVSTVATPGADIYGGTWNTGTGLVTNTFTSGEVYSASGLSGGNNSMSFANFSGTNSGQNGAAEAALLGLSAPPTSYALYVFEASPAAFVSGTDLYDIPWTTSVPLGTYVAAYGCDIAGTSSCRNGDVVASPFTTAGWITHRVPEPGTLVLLGVAFAGLSWARRRNLN